MVSASLHGYEFTLFNVIVNMHVGHLLTEWRENTGSIKSPAEWKIVPSN